MPRMSCFLLLTFSISLFIPLKSIYIEKYFHFQHRWWKPREADETGKVWISTYQNRSRISAWPRAWMVSFDGDQNVTGLLPSSIHLPNTTVFTNIAPCKASMTARWDRVQQVTYGWFCLLCNILAKPQILEWVSLLGFMFQLWFIFLK